MKNFTRREFLKVGAGTCFAMSVPPIIGCGGGDPESSGLSRAHETPVTVHAILGDELSELYDMSRQATASLGITGNAFLGKTVFIKPNLVAIMGTEMATVVNYDPVWGESTKAEIILGVAEQCLEAGAEKVTIADGAQTYNWDWDILTFFDGNQLYGSAINFYEGIEHLKNQYGDDRIQLLCLSEYDQWEYIASTSDDPYLSNGLPIAKPFCDADHVISVPVLKTHSYSQITVSMKNYIGVIKAENVTGTSMWVRHKIHNAYEYATIAGFENAGIAGAFIDIVKWRYDQGKEDFAIIDCSIGLDTLGPVRLDNYGQPARTIDFKEHSNIGKYFLLAGNDLVAADATAARITNYTVEDVKQLVMANNIGIGTQEESNITLSGASLEDLTIPDWVEAVQDGEEFFRGPMFNG